MLRTVLDFLSFKDLTHVYSLKTYLTNNKDLTFSFFEYNDSISSKFVAQILSLSIA